MFIAKIEFLSYCMYLLGSRTKVCNWRSTNVALDAYIHKDTNCNGSGNIPETA